MKIYKVKLSIKILMITIYFLVFILIGIPYLIYHTDATLLQYIIVVIAILFGIGGIYVFFNLKVIIGDEKIEVVPIRFLPRTGTLLWNEISELTSEYFLFPETGVISLIPKPRVNKKFVRFSIWGMPIELLRDILSHLPSDAKIYLYPHLKRKVEGKQTWFYRR